MPLPANPFAAAAARAVAKALDMAPDEFTVSAPPRAELGDFAVGLFPGAKAKKGAPPALAKQVADAFRPDGWLASAEAAGPFVNFRAERGAAFRHLFERAQGGGAPGRSPLVPAELGAGKTVCVDFSSPNIAKHLAYHHIRSTVIGNALVRLHRALGYRVVGINHLGDWGTPHGMLMAAYERWGAPDPLDITALNDLYVRFRAEAKGDPSLEAAGRAWFKRLEDGDPEARALWKRFREVSWGEFQQIYDQMGIVFDEVRGESEYEAAMPGVVALFVEKGLAQESEGALVVPVGDPPLLLRKSDGATTYHTRDLATALYRWQSYGFDRSLYVVDRGQGLHFKQLFDALKLAGFGWAARCTHVPFGLVRLGGKKTGTRTGNVVLLKEVFAEATRRSAALMRERNPELGEAEASAAAPVVGIGAVVFANLFAQREKDVDFEWEQVLNPSGDSGPYVQYGHARCASILRKAGAAPGGAPDPGRLAHEAEWTVARRLLDYGDVVARAAEGNEPHLLSHYLLDLCGDFSRWYTLGNGDPSLRVLCDDAGARAARLALVGAVKHVLSTGLHLLGLGAPEAM
ncbi:MAG TPA: arginine--tRNA ligase [Polyangiaceae bacterium]|nr:arginine--tRNA ligase [Polyangiaceae bacterium]